MFFNQQVKVKVKKKISFQMENRFVQTALGKLIGQRELTYSEAMIYSLMRSHAFQKKNRRCTIDHRYIATIININPKKVIPKIKKLEEAGLLEPIYVVEYRGQKIEFDSYKEAVEKFSLKAIKYKDFYVKDVPGQKDLVNEYLQNKKK